VTAARDGVLDIAPDLAESLAKGDLYYATFLDMVDAHVAQRDLDCPTMQRPARGCPILASPRRLQRSTSRPSASVPVIWATGYGVDFGWIDIPVFECQRRASHTAAASPQ
jgi:putative flavoprotein involved in K+ transport